jgi:membrane protease YdiL (CAAX protease family)
MGNSPSETYLRQRSPWRVLLPVLVFALVVVASMAVRAGSGRPPSGQRGPGAIVLSGGVGIIAIWAVWDGIRRALGRSTYLGTGRGLDRLFGLIQVLLSIGLALALLPNTVMLLDFLASGGRAP